MGQHVQTQKLYDLETNHSLDSTRQREWDKKIEGLLKEYDEFAEYD